MSTSAVKSTKSQATKKLVKKQAVKPAEEPAVEPIAVKPKKVIKKAETPAETTPTKGNTAKSAKPKKEKVQEKAQDEVQEDVKTDEEPKKVKKIKKINDKPTLSDNCGLNLSVAKVKNIISNLCINKEQFAVLKELKDARVFDEEKLDSNQNQVENETDPSDKKKRSYTFSLEGISAESLAFLEKAHQNNLELLKESFAKSKIKKMNDATKKDYTAQRKAAAIAHQSEKKSGHLFQTHEFDVAKFNVKWDKNFYKTMDVPAWKSLKDAELYDYCVSAVNKMKVRFNAESKIFVTAFVEHIVQQIVVNGTVNCINKKKKIIKMEHALNTTTEGFTERFNLFPLILNLESYHKARHEESSSEEEPEPEPETEAETKADDATEIDQVDRKYQFKYYVAELCRTVKMELARKDSPDDISKSPYYHVSVSKVFKNFCSSVIVDLIRMFGEVLKVEVATRNVKTVNYTIIQTLVHVVHIMYNLSAHLDETVQFIQQRYCAYQKFIEDRKNRRAKSDPTPEEDNDEL